MSAYSNWDLYNRNKWSKTHDMYGGELGWIVEWKANPDDHTEQVLKSRLSLIPMWWAKYGWIDLHFNPSNADVYDYNPEASVETNSGSWELGLSSDKILSLSVSGTESEPEFDIHNYSDIYRGDADVVHEYDISGDLREQTVVCNAGATTSVEETSGEVFANVDLKGRFGTHEFSYPLSNRYEYYWE